MYHRHLTTIKLNIYIDGELRSKVRLGRFYLALKNSLEVDKHVNKSRIYQMKLAAQLFLRLPKKTKNSQDPLFKRNDCNENIFNVRQSQDPFIMHF